MHITEDLKNNLIEFQTNVWHGYIHQKTGEVFLLIGSYEFIAGVDHKELMERIYYENKDQPIMITGLPPQPMIPKGDQNLLTEEALRRYIPLDNKILARNFLGKGIRKHIQEIAGYEPRPLQQSGKQLESVES